MIRSILLALAAALLVLPAYAQDDRLDELDFEEAPLKDEPVPYFAIGVGPVLSVGFPDMTALNERATALNLDDMSSPLLQWGAEIFTAVGLIPNVRVGFSWVSGTSSSTKDQTVGDSLVTRAMEYSVGSRTLHFDYAIVPFKSFAILPGLGIGGSTLTITEYQAVKDRTWSDYQLQTAPDAFSELKNSVWYLTPRLNIEYGITPFVAVRAQAAYTWQFSDSDWIGNRVSTVSGVPDGISASAFSAQVGIFVGLFN